MTEKARLPLNVKITAIVTAGFLGAGILDALLIAGSAGFTAFPSALLLGLGLHGLTGLLLGTLAGIAVRIVDHSIPGGIGGLREMDAADVAASGMLLALLPAALLVSVGMAAAYPLFIAKMASGKLATIAAAGLAGALLFPAAIVFLGARPPLTRLAGKVLPRWRFLPRTGVLTLGLFALLVLAFVAALSRADWRVLDLGPIAGIAVAIALGAGHGLFWYASQAGKRLQARLPLLTIRIATVGGIFVCLFAGSRLSDSSPVFAAVAESSFGLRFGIKAARATIDHDGDGFSARFGGGDCDDARADVFPGAEEIPGDGIDQNCEGGDAPLAEVDHAPSAAPAPTTIPTVKPREGAFAGNILLIAIDATRADRLGVAGYNRRGGKSLTPNLDALAKRGAYFRRVWSQAPNTPRSFPAIVTSRHPSEIAWQKRSLNYSNILPSNTTFFEPLASTGLRPIGIFSHFYFTADRGLSKSFVEWNNDGAKTIADSNKDIAAPRIVPKVLDRLRRAAKNNERFVLWTHLFEPHSSYMSHPEFPTSLSGVDGLEEKYDYEIAYDDLWVGKILATLEETGLAKNTTVVVFGDHGEAWGEHNRTYFHGQNLTEEQLRVPLLIAVPGRAPVVSDDEVALLDLGPTLVELVGAPAPSSFRGRSLLPALDGHPLPPRPVFAELLPSTATPDHETMIIHEGKKLVHKVSGRRFEFFDLVADPKQMKNLVDDPSVKATVDALKDKLLAFEEHR